MKKQNAVTSVESIHELFEAQASKTPDGVAAVCGSKQITYRKLNIRANQLAHLLSRRGVGPETPVGVCLERSTDFHPMTLC